MAVVTVHLPATTRRKWDDIEAKMRRYKLATRRKVEKGNTNTIAASPYSLFGKQQTEGQCHIQMQA